MEAFADTIFVFNGSLECSVQGISFMPYSELSDADNTVCFFDNKSIYVLSLAYIVVEIYVGRWNKMNFTNKLKSRNEKENPGLILVAVLFVMYVISGILLFLLALLLYKLELSEAVVKIAVIVIYLVAGVVGGLLMGKKMKDRKFLWGLLVGGCYFLLLFFISAIIKQGFSMEPVKVITTFILCAASGMAGGMIS